MKKVNWCEGSGWTGSVSDYDVLTEKTWCTKCKDRVKVKTRKDSNVVKVLRHAPHTDQS